MAELKADPVEPMLLVAVDRDLKEFIHPHMFGESCERQGLFEPASVFNFAVRYLTSPCMAKGLSLNYAGRWFDHRIAIATDRSDRLDVSSIVEQAYDDCVELDKVKLINDIALVSRPMRLRMRLQFKSESPLVDPRFGMFDQDELDAIKWALWIDD